MKRTAALCKILFSPLKYKSISSHRTSSALVFRLSGRLYCGKTYSKQGVFTLPKIYVVLIGSQGYWRYGGGGDKTIPRAIS
jgi:hypothetical protein